MGAAEGHEVPTDPGAASQPPRADHAPSSRGSALTAFVWGNGGQRTIHDLAEIRAVLADPGNRVWVDVEDADDATLQALASALGLHELVAQDIVQQGQRTKIVRWDDVLQVVVFAVRFDAGPSSVEIHVVVGSGFVLTSHPARWRPIESMQASGRDPLGQLARGVDMVLYAVLDPLVDAYFAVIDQVSDEIDTLEEAILARRDPELLERLVRTRRWLLETRHLVVPMREILDGLAERDLPMIDARNRVYFRDVYGQVVHIVEELDTQREIASGVLDAYLSGVNNSLAEVMRRLTAITAVLAGVGAAAGIFGMSEAGSALGLPTPLGFWVITAIMVMIGVLVFAYFRRIDWI